MLLNCGVGKDSWESLRLSRRSNQSILKAISPEYSLKGLMLKLQYFGHLMRRSGSFEKTLMLGKIEGRRRRGQQRLRWLNGITNSMDMSLSRLRELVMARKMWHAAVALQTVAHDRATELNLLANCHNLLFLTFPSKASFIHPLYKKRHSLSHLDYWIYPKAYILFPRKIKQKFIKLKCKIIQYCIS